MTSSLPSAQSEEPPSPQVQTDLSYMHRPPRIVPNYGKKYRGGLKLKTCVPRVLLYDNVTQQSMLDVQLNGINSQRYKIGRELEMQRKSFIIRRKLKDKLLVKLTKVEHGDDYWQFEQDYLHQAWLEDNERSFHGTSVHFQSHDFKGQGRSHTSISLPDIHSNKNGVVRSRSWDPRHSSEGGRRRKKMGAIEFRDKNTKKQHENHIGEDHVEEDSSRLPPITPAASEDITTDQETQHFVPRKKVGFRMEKGPTGVTRLFHVHPEIDEHESKGESDNRIDSENSKVVVEKLATIDENNNSSDVEEITIVQQTNQPHDHQEEPRESNTLQNRSRDTPKSKTVDSDKNAHSIEAKGSPAEELSNDNEIRGDFINPCEDERFEHLQRLLVRQNPPNDGFIELSPSFVRSYPMHHIQRRFARVVVDGEDGRRTRFSEGLTPDLSDGHSDISEEPEDIIINDSSLAMNRLGVS